MGQRTVVASVSRQGDAFVAKVDLVVMGCNNSYFLANDVPSLDWATGDFAIRAVVKLSGDNDAIWQDAQVTQVTAGAQPPGSRGGKPQWPRRWHSLSAGEQ